MLILSPTTIANAAALRPSSVPKRFLGRVLLLPRSGCGWADGLRLFLEIEFLRYTSALLPFVFAMLIWRDLALPIAQAPLVLVIAIGIVEMKVLRYSAEARKALLPAGEVAQRLDVLRFRAQAILARIAARKDLSAGRLFLVVEQSELARIAPLTFVSVQADAPRPDVLDLDEGDRTAIRDLLFDEAFDERALQQANQAEGTFVRQVAFDARGVSAHARLKARLDRGQVQSSAGVAPA